MVWLYICIYIHCMVYLLVDSIYAHILYDYLLVDSIYAHRLYGLSIGWLYIWILTLYFIYGLTLNMNIYSMVYLWVDSIYEYIFYRLFMGWLYIRIYILSFLYGLTLYMNIYLCFIYGLTLYISIYTLCLYMGWLSGEFSDKNYNVSPRGYITILYYIYCIYTLYNLHCNVYEPIRE